MRPVRSSIKPARRHRAPPDDTRRRAYMWTAQARGADPTMLMQHASKSTQITELKVFF